MPKYRKKAVVIEAEEWQPGRKIEGVCDCTKPLWYGKPGPHIHTLEGAHFLTPGDMVITGVKGEKYPCKPDIFAATYDAA